MAAKPRGKDGTGKGPRRLNPRQRAFISEYQVDFNGTQAAIRAGYSAKSARQAATMLLRNPAIKAAISNAAKLRARQNNLDADFVLRKLGLLATSDIATYLKVEDKGKTVTVRDLSELTPEQRYAVSEIVIIDKPDGSQRLRLKLESKVAALRDLGRHKGVAAFEDRVKVAPGEALADYLDRLDGKNEGQDSRPGDREGGVG